jgi:hypothetical protein
MSDRKQRAEQAVSEFEEERQRLYRRDGTPVFGEAEHQERMGALVSGLQEELEAEIDGAREDVAAYEHEALALSYADPTKGLASTDRERFSASLPLVREDCQAMPLRSLVERLRAVAAGSDKVPKILHARYAEMRADAEDARLRELARDRATATPATAEDVRFLRELRAVAAELELQTQDEDRARRREAAEEGAHRNRRLAMELRGLLSSADGTNAAAREEMRAASRI